MYLMLLFIIILKLYFVLILISKLLEFQPFYKLLISTVASVLEKAILSDSCFLFLFLLIITKTNIAINTIAATIAPAATDPALLLLD